MPHEFRSSTKDLSPYFIQADVSDFPSNDALDLGDLDPEGQFNLREYWIVILKHQSLVLGLLVLAVSLTGLVVFTMTPIYTAESTLLIERQTPQVLDIKGVTAEAQEGVDELDYYKTQYDILKSRSLASEVIRLLGLESNPLFAHERGPIRFLTGAAQSSDSRQLPIRIPSSDEGTGDETETDPQVIDAYLGRLTIRPQVGTRLVVVGVSTPDPVLSAQITNAHVHAYIQQGMSLHAQAGKEAERFLAGKLAELKDRVEKSEAALIGYRRSHGIVAFSLNDKSKLLSERLDDLNKALTGAETARIALEAEVLQINKHNYDGLPEVIDSPLIQNLKEQLSQQQAEFASMANQFRHKYPPLEQLRAKVNDSWERLRAEETRIVAGIESRYRTALAREQKLKTAEQQETAHAMSMNESSLQDTILAREVETSRQLYKSVFERMRQIGVDSEVRVSNVSIVDKAEVPRRPSQPRKLLSLSLAVILGLLSGVGLAFLLEYMDQTLKSPEAAERYLRLPSLGVVPDFAKNKSARYQALGYTSRVIDRGQTNGSPDLTHKDLVISDNPFSAASEAYRAVRTGTLLSRAGEPPKTILITSAHPGEGKTVTAVNVALAFARLGGRTLLVDADLRRPRCLEVLGCANGPGLTEILTGARNDIDRLIHVTSSGGLHFLNVGSIPPNPAELLGSPQMRDTVHHLAAEFDHVIFDSAPVLPVTDTILLSRFVDGVVIIVGPNSPKQSVSTECTRLKRAGAKIFGVVLNRVDVERNPHYYTYNGYSMNGYHKYEPRFDDDGVSYS